MWQRRNVKKWTTIQRFEGYEYNHDYDEDQPVYRETRVPVVNGVVFEYYKDGDEFIAFGSKRDHKNYLEEYDFVDSKFIY
mgnify:CR=1 FL=1